VRELGKREMRNQKERPTMGKRVIAVQQEMLVGVLGGGCWGVGVFSGWGAFAVYLGRGGQ